MAAADGDVGGVLNYARCLAAGRGVDKSDAEAAQYFSRAAERGNPEAQFEGPIRGRISLRIEVGVRLIEESGSAAEARLWFKKAADQVHVPAMLWYAKACEEGIGGPQDHPEALRYFQLAAANGDADGHYAVGQYHYEGVVVTGTPEFSIAAREFDAAAKQGHATAMVNLACMMAGEEGVRDDAQARINLLKKASDLGNAQAAYYLGMCFAEGEGVAQDMRAAADYFNLAASRGHEKAQAKLDEMFD
jgi:TPR repeat protein